MPLSNLSSQRILEIELLTTISSRYNGVVPCKVEFTLSPVFMGTVVTLSIPGQLRSVFISQRRLQHWSEEDRESIREEVLFALFLLLDEDEDDV